MVEDVHTRQSSIGNLLYILTTQAFLTNLSMVPNQTGHKEKGEKEARASQANR